MNQNSTTIEVPKVEVPAAEPAEIAVNAPVETIATPETREAESERRAALDAQAAADLRSSLTATAVPVAGMAKIEKPELERKIDKILEADLKDLYKELPDNVKPEFKHRAEHASSVIKDLIESAKATAIKIVDVLREWLRIIPVSSAIFVEQIIKIKTDQLMALVSAIKTVAS
ncbi:MAG: hypothetical protein WCJ29_01740 [bacterium]